jgi:NADPH-dependent 2,4-dienoyl-CoA reductase/sulfur reductase-like enzyme
VCIPECPVNAILPEEDVPGDQLAFIKLNADLSRQVAQHHQAQGRAARCRRVERPQEQAGPAEALNTPMEPKLNAAVADTARSHDGPIETDAVIVGAGPVGLFQVFELGLLEIKAHVIDSLAYPGGQCIELYPDKPIYDIPAVPVCTGKELTDNLLKQIEPFGATFHFGQEVTEVRKQDDGRFFVETSKGTQFLTKTIFIAGGVGSFQPRTLKVDGSRSSTTRSSSTA